MRIGLYATDEQYQPLETEHLSDEQCADVLCALHRTLVHHLPITDIAFTSTRLRTCLEKSKLTRLIDFRDDVPRRFMKQRGLGHNSYAELRGIAKTWGMHLPEWDGEVKR